MSSWRTNRETGQHFQTRKLELRSTLESAPKLFKIPPQADIDRITDMIMDEPVPKELLDKYTVTIPLSQVEQVEYSDILTGRLDPQDEEDEGMGIVEGFEESYRHGDYVKPILVLWNRDSESYVIRDGAHRVMALQNLRRPTAQAIVIGFDE